MKDLVVMTGARQRAASAGNASGPRVSGSVTVGLFGLAFCGLGIAMLALLVHRPVASVVIGVGAVVTGMAATIWAAAPSRVIGGAMVAIVGIATMMIGCGIS